MDNPHQDVLNEVINIGFGAAAEALSDLLGHRVLLSVPKAIILNSADVPGFIQQHVDQWGVFIAQEFDGGISGQALLVYSETGSLQLVTALLGDQPRTTSLTEVAKATLEEVGNIILGSCVSVFGDLLEERLRFSIPFVSMQAPQAFFGTLIAGSVELDKAIAVKSKLTIAERQIHGMIIVFLSFADVELVVRQAQERWAP